MIILGADKELAIFCEGANGQAALAQSTFALSAEVLANLHGISKKDAEEEAAMAAMLFERDIKKASDPSFNKRYYRSGAAKNSKESYIFDSNRIWLPSNGGCFYIDMGHVEMALPECSTAERYLATHDAMLEMVNSAMKVANAKRECPIKMGMFNSDMYGNSWGGHDNFGISYKSWYDMCGERPLAVNMLASFQASAVLLCGQGKVGVENDMPATTDGFQMTTRADFLKSLTSIQTTYDRPLINTRNEPHGKIARLHVIWFDHTVAPVATYLRVGAMSLFLAMMEEMFVNDPSVMIEHPLNAAINMQRDTTLNAKFKTLAGEMTIVDVQDAFCTMAEYFVESGRHALYVDDSSARNIVALWRRVVDDFRNPDWLDLNSRRIDWVMKLKLLKTLSEKSGMPWDTAALDAVGKNLHDKKTTKNSEWASRMRMMDVQFHSLDDTSMFRKLRFLGQVEEVLTAEQYVSLSQPDPRTRASTRAFLINAALKQGVHASINWDRFTCEGQSLHMPDPLMPLDEGVVSSAGSTREAIIKLYTHQATVNTGEKQ